MRPLKAILLALLLTGPAFGQGAVLVLDLGNNTQIAMVTLPSGETVIIPNVTIFKVPPPSPPAPLVTEAMLVYESGDQTQEQNQVQILIRLDPKLSAKVPLILDKDTTLPDGNPIPKLQSALQLIGNQPLPQLVGFNGSGAAVVHEPLPPTVREAGLILERWLP
jgi:hypothetical protein